MNVIDSKICYAHILQLVFFISIYQRHYINYELLVDEHFVIDWDLMDELSFFFSLFCGLLRCTFA